MLGRDVTSSASNPSAWNSATSASCRSRRRSARTGRAIAGLEMADEPLQSQAITVGPEARHHAHREIREQRAPPLRLASEDVGQMQDRKSTRLNSSHVEISYA